MLRKIEWLTWIFLSFIKLPIVSLLSGGRIKFRLAERISPNAKFAVGNEGRICIGKNCIVESSVICRASRGSITVGDHVYINRNCNIVSHEEILIGEHCTIGPNVCIYDHDHDFYNLEDGSKFIHKPIKIGKNVWIGANVVILKGTIIGDNSVIAAGVVVSGKVGDHVIFMSKHENIQKPILH